MSTITKERVAQYANDPRMCNVNDEIRQMARIALASLEAEPYGYTDGEKYGMLYEPRHVDRLSNPRALYTAPPATVSVMDEAQSRELFEKNCMANIERNKWHPDLYAHVPAREQWAAWEACRAAMLQGADGI